MSEFIELTTVGGRKTMIRKNAIVQVFQEAEPDPRYKTGGENGVVTKDGFVTMATEDYERIRQLLMD